MVAAANAVDPVDVPFNNDVKMADHQDFSAGT